MTAQCVAAALSSNFGLPTAWSDKYQRQTLHKSFAKIVVVPNFQHPRSVRVVHDSPLRRYPTVNFKVAGISHITRGIQYSLQMNA